MLERTGSAARTADGLKHLNTVTIPGFGVTKLQLEAVNGGATSAYSTQIKTTAGSAVAFNFAPGRLANNTAIDEVKINYTINDPTRSARHGRLELFVRFDKDPVWTIELQPKQLKHGEHSIPWSGYLPLTIAADQADEANAKFTHRLSGTGAVDKKMFPDNFITAADSPYRLKITVGGEVQGTPPTAWTDFHILLHSIELELGLQDTLKEQRDKDVWTSLGGNLPKETDANPTKVFLKSNLFKIKGGDMYDNTLFKEYEDLWKLGPDIPVFAKVFVKNAQGQKEAAPESAVALGNVKFLWDYEDIAQDTTGITRAPVKKYIKRALKYYKDDSRPKGDNCHHDRGGKRRDRPYAVVGSYHPVFPDQAGEDPTAGHKADHFPFKVEKCERSKRYWSAISYAWTHGTLRGKTGVMFQPSRMAGDAYKLTVYLAYDRNESKEPLLDIDDAIDSAVKVKSGIFEIWRRINIASYIRKNAAIGDYFAGAAWPNVLSWYQEAFIDPDLNAKAVSFLHAGNYHTQADAALQSALGADLYQFYVPTAANQSTGGTALTFNSYAQMRAAVKAWFVTNNPTMTDAEAATGRDNWVGSSFPHGLAPGSSAVQITAAQTAKYNQRLNNISSNIVKAALDGLNLLAAAGDGVSIVEFAGLQNQASGTTTLGVAIDATGHTRSKCLFMGFAPTDEVMAHEVGHHLMCPHAHGEANGTGDGPGHSPKHHDKDDSHCLMSYNRPLQTYCGLCHLRLRGWDLGELDKDGTKNEKT